MKIKTNVILIIVGICILFAIFNSLIVDLIMKNSTTGCIKARIFAKSTGKTSSPLLNYNFSYKSKEYTGVISGKKGLEIEDSLFVVFLEAYPNISRPIFFFKEGEKNVIANSLLRYRIIPFLRLSYQKKSSSHQVQ